MRLRRRALLAAALAMPLGLAAQRSAVMPLPQLPARVVLRTAYFHNRRPLLDDRVYNEFVAWLAAAAASAWPFEVILTNQLIAGVEYSNNHLHSSLRGGVTNGLTTQSPHSRYGLVSVLSLYPFTSNDEATLELRGGVRSAGGEPAQWAAALLVHELGHQLLHLNHPFGHPACVMNAPPMLLFRQWLAGLDAAACPLGSSPEMTPGAIRFTQIPKASQ